MAWDRDNKILNYNLSVLLKACIYVIDNVLYPWGMFLARGSQ